MGFAKHLIKGNFVKIYKEIWKIYSETRNYKSIKNNRTRIKIGIIFTPHTFFLANLISAALKINQKECEPVPARSHAYKIHYSPGPPPVRTHL